MAYILFSHVSCLSFLCQNSDLSCGVVGVFRVEMSREKLWGEKNKGMLRKSCCR